MHKSIICVLGIMVLQGYICLETWQARGNLIWSAWENKLNGCQRKKWGKWKSLKRKLNNSLDVKKMGSVGLLLKCTAYNIFPVYITVNRHCCSTQSAWRQAQEAHIEERHHDRQWLRSKSVMLICNDVKWIRIHKIWWMRIRIQVNKITKLISTNLLKVEKIFLLFCT